MTSQYEAEGDTAVLLQPRLVHIERRSVSRLQFHSLEKPAAQICMPQETEAGPEEMLEEDLNVPSGTQVITQNQEIQMLIEEAHTTARENTEKEWSRRLDDSLAAERAKVAEIAGAFEREKKHYFAAVEAEVVRLSLSIAEHVLHREVELDPMLLSGAAKVALGQIAEGSTMKLHVPTKDLETWRNVFQSQYPDLELVGEPAWEAGECRLDSSVGRVELGMRTQLKEIERGFFDLLQQRPA